MLDDSFEVAYLAGLVVGCAIRGVYAHPRRSRRVAKRLPTALDSALLVLASLGFLLPLAHIFTPWLTFADYRRPAWVGGVGTGIYAGALVLLWLSHVSLGDHWSPRAEILAGHVLVTQGVYRFVRHPMYAAHFLWGIAQALLLANWLAGPAMLVVMLPVYLVRVPREERLLRERFGGAYEAWAARTGRLLPRRRASSGARPPEARRD